MFLQDSNDDDIVEAEWEIFSSKHQSVGSKKIKLGNSFKLEILNMVRLLDYYIQKPYMPLDSRKAFEKIRADTKFGE